MKTVTINTRQCIDLTIRLQVPDDWDKSTVRDELTHREMRNWFNAEIRRVHGAIADGDSVDWRTFPHDFKGSLSNVHEPEDIVFENKLDLMTPGATPPDDVLARYKTVTKEIAE